MTEIKRILSEHTTRIPDDPKGCSEHWVLDYPHRLVEAIEQHVLKEKRYILKMFEELTPQGSEFHNNPEYVRDYLKDLIKSGHEAKIDRVKLRREIVELKKD